MIDDPAYHDLCKLYGRALVDSALPLTANAANDDNTPVFAHPGGRIVLTRKVAGGEA